MEDILQRGSYEEKHSMALIDCSECGSQISDKATACPKCGAPLHGSKGKAFKQGNSNSDSHGGSETIYYSDEHNVRITNTRFIVGTSTYPLSGITSITTAIVPVSKLPGIFILIFGLVILFASNGSAVGIVFGLVLAVAGVLIIIGTKDKHAVKISTSAAETNALSSDNKEYIVKVASALNEAIIHRG